MFEKIKKKIEEYRENTDIVFRPNSSLYILMVYVSLVLIILSTLWIENSVFMDVILSVGSGIFASALVAWLIESSNCRAEKRRTEASRELVFSGLAQAFTSWAGLFVDLLRLPIQEEENRSEHTWINWIELAYRKSEEYDCLTDFCKISQKLAENIIDEVNPIQYQTAQLLNSGLVGEKEVHILSTISTLCDATILQTQRSGANASQQFIKTFRIINKLLDSSDIFCEINNKKVRTVSSYVMNK